MPRAEARVPADDLAYREGRGCYTTARAAAGRLRHGERAARRLVRDATNVALVHPGNKTVAPNGGYVVLDYAEVAAQIEAALAKKKEAR